MWGDGIWERWEKRKTVHVRREEEQAQETVGTTKKDSGGQSRRGHFRGGAVYSMKR